MNQENINKIATYLCDALYGYRPLGPISKNMHPDAQMAYATTVDIFKRVATWVKFDKSDYNEVAALLAYAMGWQFQEGYDFHTDYRPLPQRVLALAYEVVAKMLSI
jgi:hypothetical protein